MQSETESLLVIFTDCIREAFELNPGSVTCLSVWAELEVTQKQASNVYQTSRCFSPLVPVSGFLFIYFYKVSFVLENVE